MIRRLALPSIIATACAATPAVAQDGRRVTVAPYIEVSQAVDADLRGGEVLTYTDLAAGVDASIATRSTNGQVSVAYEHRFAEDRYDGDTDIITGIGRLSTRLTNGLGFELGGLATRTREDIRGDAPGLLIGNDANIAKLYSVYGGPTFATHAGDVSIGAAYRVGYTKVDTSSPSGVVGLPALDYVDHSLGQSATGSIGIAPGTVLPIGVTLSGGWNREDANQLDQRLNDLYGQLGVVAPVLPTLALAGDVGYERLTVSQRDPLFNPDGTAVTDASGRLVTDEGSPRRIAYRTDGVYWDAGVIWRPNHRTSLSAYVGHRYGSMSYTGSLTYQASRRVGVAVSVYDNVETFGEQLTNGLAQLPTSFIAARDAFSQQYNGCVFSSSGTTPGGCLDGVFQSLTGASYRARGVDAAISIAGRRTTYGFGAGYANRELFAPAVPGIDFVSGDEDQSAYAQFFWSYKLSPVSGLQANVFGDWYRSGVSPVQVWSYGATASYYHNFGRLGTTATIGIYDFKQSDVRSQIAAQALLGARYTF